MERGTYEDAVDFGIFYKALVQGDPILPSKSKAKTVILHNGASKIGDLMFRENGTAFFLNENGEVSFAMNSQSIPTLANMTGATTEPVTVDNSAVGNITTPTELTNKVNITKDNSSLEIHATLTVNVTDFIQHPNGKK